MGGLFRTVTQQLCFDRASATYWSSRRAPREAAECWGLADLSKTDRCRGNRRTTAQSALAS